jgi:integrase
MRKLRQKRGPRMFTAEQLHSIIDGAGVQLKAMIYLGINCGFGNHDCALLTFRDVNISRGWIDFARPKTDIDRRCPLWPETVKAVKAAIAKRPEPKDKAHEDRVFITKYGQPPNTCPPWHACPSLGPPLGVSSCRDNRNLNQWRPLRLHQFNSRTPSDNSLI